MAIDQFVPEYWSAVFRDVLDSRLVYAQPGVINRNWEGEITEAGDTVHIFRIGDPTIKTYVPNNDMDPPERPDGVDAALVVDQFKYFNIAIDDVNKAQTIGDLLAKFGDRAARGMRSTVDVFVGAKMVADAVAAGNQLGTDAAPLVVAADPGAGETSPYALAVQLKKDLDDREVPDEGRFLVADPGLEAELLLDTKFVPAGDDRQLNGHIGQIAGFVVLKTTAVPKSPGSGGAPVANHKIVAGTDDGVTFANQLTEIKAYEIERQFGDAVKGLEVYGAKTIEPDVLTVAHVAD